MVPLADEHGNPVPGCDTYDGPKAIPKVLVTAFGASIGDQPAEAFDRYYPERALSLEKTGSAKLDCIAEAGRLTRCTGPHDDSGLKFDEYALKLANALRIPRSSSGRTSLVLTFIIGGYEPCSTPCCHG
jgi:hypothetical protein